MGELSDVPSGSLFLFAKVQIYCICICLTVTKIVPYSKAFCQLEVICKIYYWIFETVLERSSGHFRMCEKYSINTNRDQIPLATIWKRNPGPLTTGAEQPAPAAGVTHFYLREETNFHFPNLRLQYFYLGYKIVPQSKFFCVFHNKIFFILFILYSWLESTSVWSRDETEYSLPLIVIETLLSTKWFNQVKARY